MLANRQYTSHSTENALVEKQLVTSTPHLQLSLVSQMDLADVHAMHLLPETHYYNTVGIPENIEATQAFLTNWIRENISGSAYIFVARLKHDNSFAGMAGIRLGKPLYRNAEIWYKLHKNFWGRGYATEVARELVRFGFSELGLHRIEAGCAVDNLASVRVLEKCGMTREGRTRKLLPLMHGWSDNFQYAVLEEDLKQTTITI